MPLTFESVLAEAEAASPAGPRLNVGCGRDLRAGYVNSDVHPLPGVDVVAELGRHPLPFPDRTFTLVAARDVLEAAAAGIPVIASTAEAHRELTGGAVPLFDPLDPWAIAAAIDDALARGPHPPPAQQVLADAAPDPAGFATRVVSVLDEVT